MEFSPYKFYKKETISKLSTRPIPLSNNPCLIRLHTITFSPEDARLQLILRIEFVEGKKFAPIEFASSSLFYNPVHKDTLFFRCEKHDYTDIELPSGHKQVKYSIISLDETLQYEVALTCMYIKHTYKQTERFKVEDFDGLKVIKSIIELCDQCIDAEHNHEVWASAYSELIKEIETIIQKRVFLCDLPDELIVFRQLTRFK